MSIYQYSDPSLIKRVHFSFANDRPAEALLRAPDSADPRQLADLRRTIEAHGWQSIPVFADGAAQLHVSGFQKPQHLLNFLNAHGYSQGEPSVTAEASDNTTLTRSEWLQDSSLKLCGWSYIVGDVALLISGLMSGRRKEAVSGALYTAGGAVLARYGNVKTEHHVRDVSERMAEYLKEQACELPDSCSLSRVLEKKRTGALHHVEHFLYTYPSQTTVGIYTLGAFSMLQSGLRHGKPWDIAYGANSTLAGAASILIPERHPEPGQPKPSTAVGQWWEWIQEKPLRMAGYAYILSGLALGMSALREMRDNPKQKSYIFKFITTGTYLLGDIMLAISNKNAANADGTFDAMEKQRIIGMAAEAISHEPAEVQHGLAQYVAGFLAHQPEIRDKAPALASAIEEQIAHMRQNPWAARASNSSGSALAPPPR